MGRMRMTQARTAPARLTPFDAWNIMGRGCRLYLLNAVSWKERIAIHTSTTSNQWDVTGVMETPTRRMPAGLMNLGLAPALW
jgi:hypothetical protein